MNNNTFGLSIAALRCASSVSVSVPPIPMATQCFFPLSHFYFSPTASNPAARVMLALSPPRKGKVGKAQVLLVRCARRTGKRRYPSERKKLDKLKETLLQTHIPNRDQGYWRLSKLTVPAHKDPGKDFVGVSLPLLEAIAKLLKFPVAPMLPEDAFRVVRKSFDARKVLKEPAFVYTVEMDVKKLLELEPRTWDFICHLEPKLGIAEYMEDAEVPVNLLDMLEKGKSHGQYEKRPRVAVVGSGPSGLFAALVLAEVGAHVTLIERGQPVEQRGRDIGALVVRKLLSSESNFCFGEGGAGTWSDGKLVTRIGRNSDNVQAVLRTLVRFGAPPNILVDGKPHLGTDKLVPLLRNFRHYLISLGVDIKFNTRLDDLVVENGQVKGVVVSNAQNEPGCTSDQHKLLFDAVVLAVGHSARDVYSMLLQHNIELVPKDFAVGLRIEHPQELINSIQYCELASEVESGRGRIPVADYKVAKYVGGDECSRKSSSEMGVEKRSCYSFCMCPGGQVVLTSTNPSELCINGMSFSRRASKWANSALVVTVSSDEFDLFKSFGPLAGVEFQREFERRAAEMGGGNFVVPAQCVTDFLAQTLSVTSLPASSYRLGVKASRLHNLFPPHITKALQRSIEMFDKELPGYITKDALLHGVETRTSSPVQITRQAGTCESNSIKGLYPIGEGAGYAGGIVSAAVDGMFCGFALAKQFSLYGGDVEAVLGKAQKQTSFVKY